MQINFNKFYLKLQILTICIEIAYARAAITDRGEGLRDEPYAIESCREVCFNTRIRVIAQNYHRIKQIRHQSPAPGAARGVWRLVCEKD